MGEALFVKFEHKLLKSSYFSEINHLDSTRLCLPSLFLYPLECIHSDLTCQHPDVISQSPCALWFLLVFAVVFFNIYCQQMFFSPQPGPQFPSPSDLYIWGLVERDNSSFWTNPKPPSNTPLPTFFAYNLQAVQPNRYRMQQGCWFFPFLFLHLCVPLGLSRPCFNLFNSSVTWFL